MRFDSLRILLVVELLTLGSVPMLFELRGVSSSMTGGEALGILLILNEFSEIVSLKCGKVKELIWNKKK